MPHHEGIQKSGGIACILTSPLSGYEWSATCSSYFITGEWALTTHWIGGWMGYRAGLDTVAKRRNYSPCWESNP